MSTQNASTARPRNGLLIQIRRWHGWLGVGLAAFIVFVSASGIVLNHKEAFLGKPAKPEGKEMAAKKPKPGEEGPSGILRTTTALSSMPISFEQAMLRAQEHFGDAPIEKIELKDENGDLVYKVNAGHGREVMLYVSSGELMLKGGVEMHRQKQAGGEMTASYDWGKIIKDLHTGNLGGLGGKLFVDFIAVVMMSLTLSGLYLWAVPKWRKRQAATKAAAASARTRLPEANTGEPLLAYRSEAAAK